MATSTILTMTAKELKNRTGEALRAVEDGRQVLLTRRLRPVGLMTPAGLPSREPGELSYEEAWREIDAALRESTPRDRTWKPAMDRSRRRG